MSSTLSAAASASRGRTLAGSTARCSWPVGTLWTRRLALQGHSCLRARRARHGRRGSPDGRGVRNDFAVGAQRSSAARPMTTRSATEPFGAREGRTMRRMVTSASTGSPFLSKRMSPRMPFSTRVLNNSLVTEARVPSERAIASSRISADWAAKAVKSWPGSPVRASRSCMNRFPAGGSSEGSASLKAKYTPRAAGPACAKLGWKSSCPISVTRRPRRARRSRSSAGVVLDGQAASMTASAPVAAIRRASCS